MFGDKHSWPWSKLPTSPFLDNFWVADNTPKVVASTATCCARRARFEPEAGAIAALARLAIQRPDAILCNLEPIA